MALCPLSGVLMATPTSRLSGRSTWLPTWCWGAALHSCCRCAGSATWDPAQCTVMGADTWETSPGPEATVLLRRRQPSPEERQVGCFQITQEAPKEGFRDKGLGVSIGGDTVAQACQTLAEPSRG